MGRLPAGRKGKENPPSACGPSRKATGADAQDTEKRESLHTYLKRCSNEVACKCFTSEQGVIAREESNRKRGIGGVIKTPSRTDWRARRERAVNIGQGAEKRGALKKGERGEGGEGSSPRSCDQ